jgi:sulfur carrier protein ThiS
VTVTVHMHGNLRRFMAEGRDRARVDVAGGATVEDLLRGLGAERDTWLVAVNNEVVERDRVLAADDVVDCFEPVAAG